MNLCSWESLCDLRQDCCHHFVSERDFGRDAQRVCQAEKVSDESLGRDETSCVRLATSNVLSQVTVNFIVKKIKHSFISTVRPTVHTNLSQKRGFSLFLQFEGI